MDLPLGYKVSYSTSNLVCKLVKSIYGLRQASREWNAELSSFLLDFGFLNHWLIIPCLFIQIVHFSPLSWCMLMTY